MTPYLRVPRLDRHFEIALGVRVDTYWQGPLLGLDIGRLDEEVLHSGDLSPAQALSDRIAVHYRGVQHDELLDYVRRLL